MKNNKEIKFRAWDKEQNNMWHWEKLIDKQCTYLNSKYFVAMQFTGLKDKNGKEIYEGDILKNIAHKNQLVEVYWKGIVIKENGWINFDGWDFRKITDDNEFKFAMYDNMIEVVGNIYENSNLLT